MKLVADYTRMSFTEVQNLDILTYKLLLKDAFISRMSETESGQEYLRTAWELSQTHADHKGIRKLKEAINA